MKISILQIITIILVYLKLRKKIKISWFMVVLPLIIEIIFFIWLGWHYGLISLYILNKYPIINWI